MGDEMRFRFLALPLAAACLALCAGALEAATPKAKPKPATPPDPRVWSLAKGEDTFALRYALPRDVDPSFAATCQPSANLLQIAVEVKTKKIASGDGVPLSLSNGHRRLELAATAFLGSSDGDLVVEAAVSLNTQVLDLFREGDTLVIKLPGETQSLPLAGVRPRLADFERVCLPRR